MSMRGPRPMVSRHPGPYGQPGPARPLGLGARQTIPGPRPLSQMRPGIPGQHRMSGHMTARPTRPLAPRPIAPRPQAMGPRPLATNVGHITNDPKGAHCRVFVGNLNTLALKKEDIESIFGQYGPIVGISVHKGYAFVQYSDAQQARVAATGQNGKKYAGQALDTNIASEPKRNAALKRPAVQSVGKQGSAAPTPAKVARPDSVTGSRTLVSVNSTAATSTAAPSAAAPSITITRPMKKSTISTGNDVLICGTCKSLFNNLSNFIQHKKQKCELKVIVMANQEQEKGEARELLCAVCDVQFTSAWDLCQHCQEEHSIAIFKEAGMIDGLNGDKE